MTDQSTRRRVKLYALNAERQWDDRGTGHVTSTYVEKLQGVSLLVKAESDGNILLESKIQPETIYQKQQETLIVWSEGDNFDLALSFQERAGCDEIWERICQVQGRDPSVEITQEVVEESEDERFDDMSDTVPSIELPAAEMGRLEEISELINSCLHSAIKREKLTLAVEADNYIPKLMRMFQMCEDLENTAGLHHLHDIIINLFQLNKNALIEAMFKIDVIFDVVGCLEYDPANPKPTRHREYLKQMANFKQVLPIRNSELLAKIHQTYRVQYIQDIVLPTPTMFEDNVLSTLSSFIFFNKLDIVRQLQDDEKFLTEFFSLLSEEKTPITKRRDLVLFLKEFCTFSHTLQPQSKETFFKTLLSLGVLQALETTLTVDAGETSQHGHVIKAACVDVLMYIVETVPSMVREHMLQQAEACDDDQLLMNLIVEQMVCDRDPEVGLAVPLSGIIRILIDPDNMMAALNRSEKTEFFAFFYKHCMHSLVAPLLSNTTDESPLHDDPATVQLLNLVLELLSFCVEHHTFHAKNFIITRNMVARILVLMKSKHKYLVLDALRFLRKMVALKDENYNRHIVKQNLFAPVVEAFFHNQGRYNLLDSAVIELFEFVKTEDIKTLLSYIVETFGDKLLDVTYVPTFRSLKQRYEQQQDRLQQRTTALESVPSILRGTSRYRRDPRQMDEDEEMWFNDDDEFEETVEPPPAGLAAAAVSDLEHIGKMIEGRGKLFTSSPAASAELTAEKESLDVAGVTAAPLVAAPGKLPLTPAQNSAVSMVKKVGLVDYDADSDEEEEEGCEDEHLSPLALQLPAAAAALQLSNSPSQLSGSPNQLSGSPSQLSGSPNQLSGSPNQLSGSPNQLSSSPNQLSSSPNQLSGSPNQLSSSPNQLSGSPNQLACSPNQLTGSPSHLSNSPNQLSGSPSQFSGSLSAGTSPVSIVNSSSVSAGALSQSPLYSPPAQQLASSTGQLAGSKPSASPQQLVTSSQQTPASAQQEKPTEGVPRAAAAPADSTQASSGQKNGSVAAELPAEVDQVAEQESQPRLAAQLKAANEKPTEGDVTAITVNGQSEPEPALDASVSSPSPPRLADSTDESADAVDAKAPPPGHATDSSKSSVTSNDETSPVGASAEAVTGPAPESDDTATDQDSVSSSEQPPKEPPADGLTQPGSEEPAADATAEDGPAAAADSASESTAGAGGRPRRDDDDDQLPCAKRARLDGT